MGILVLVKLTYKGKSYIKLMRFEDGFSIETDEMLFNARYLVDNWVNMGKEDLEKEINSMEVEYSEVDGDFIEI